MQWLKKHHPDFRYKVRFGAPPGAKKSKFAGWSDGRIYRWLLANYPKPKSHWVEVILNVHSNPTGTISEMTVAGSYEHCMNQLSYELWMNREEDVQFIILIQPAQRRAKKQMWMQSPHFAGLPKKLSPTELEAKGPRLHVCSQCGAKGQWAPPEAIIFFCAKCKLPMKPRPPTS